MLMLINTPVGIALKGYIDLPTYQYVCELDQDYIAACKRNDPPIEVFNCFRTLVFELSESIENILENPAEFEDSVKEIAGNTYKILKVEYALLQRDFEKKFGAPILDSLHSSCEIIENALALIKIRLNIREIDEKIAAINKNEHLESFDKKKVISSHANKKFLMFK